MRQILHRAASVATGALATLGVAACGTTDVASSGQDRVIPDVSISIESAFGPAGFDTVSVSTRPGGAESAFAPSKLVASASVSSVSIKRSRTSGREWRP